MRTIFLSLSATLIFWGCSKKNINDPERNNNNPVLCGITGITIGNQKWSCKNLDVTTYRNGDQIPQVTDPNQWDSLTTGAWCYYNNDSTNGATYGKLYNWYAVNDPRGLAPLGWHIPSDAEWTTLVTTLGGPSVAGGKMKEAGISHWNSPNYGATNSSGFTGLPGGLRYKGDIFLFIGGWGYWWSSSEYNITNHALSRSLGSAWNFVGRDDNDKQAGLSVRCIKD